MSIFYQNSTFMVRIYHHFFVFFMMVRLTGLEPARRETPDPKSGASTNSATGARERSLLGPEV